MRESYFYATAITLKSNFNKNITVAVEECGKIPIRNSPSNFKRQALNKTALLHCSLFAGQKSFVSKQHKPSVAPLVTKQTAKRTLQKQAITDTEISQEQATAESKKNRHSWKSTHKFGSLHWLLLFSSRRSVRILRLSWWQTHRKVISAHS